MARHPAFARTAHRPWPVPRRRWAVRFRWLDLLFAHWPVPAEALRPLVPAGLEIDTFGGSAWVGVVPFRMDRVMLRPLPDLPGVSAFPELNLRLYVTRDGKPGVWFVSLDAASAIGVWVARTFFRLPYYRATMSATRNDAGVHFRSRRRGVEPAVSFDATYGPAGEVFEAAPGSLEAFLTERYCLYAHAAGRLYRGEVQHAPWPLQRGTADFRVNDLFRPPGLTVTGEPHLLYSDGVDVVAWGLERA